MAYPVTYKISLIFSAGGYGWSETYYLNVTGVVTPKFILQNYGENLMYLRMQFLSKDAELNYIRISLVGTPFTAQTFPNNNGNYSLNVGAINEDMDTPNVALLCKFYNIVPGNARSLFLRGIPENCIVNGDYTPTTAFQGAFNNWAVYMLGAQGSNWGWWGVTSKVSSIGTSYTVGTDYRVTVKSANPVFGAAVANKKYLVRFAGWNFKSALNGTQVCYNVDASTFITKDQISLVPFTIPGTIELPTFGFQQTGLPIVERAMTRKCGRQLFLERGRAPRRIRT